MVINAETLDLETSKQCDSSGCKNKIEGEGHKIGDLTFCDEHYDIASAMSWRSMRELGYNLPTTLASYYS